MGASASKAFGRVGHTALVRGCTARVRLAVEAVTKHKQEMDLNSRVRQFWNLTKIRGGLVHMYSIHERFC